MSLREKYLGLLSTGEDAKLYILEAGDFSITVSDFGATLLSILMPAKRGEKVDVLLAPASLAGLLANKPFLGSSVGRVANRIAGSRFVLGGREYKLEANDGANHLHGGIKGFDKRLWKALALEDGPSPRVKLGLFSPDGDQGYPGNLEVAATFCLDPSGILSIVYEAKSDATTVVNLTNHAYFNLRGEGRGDVLGHRLRLDASRYLEAGEGLIPTGKIKDVAGGPFDFRKQKLIGSDIGLVDGGSAGHGYDHCFVLDRSSPGLVEFAELSEPESGRSMTVSTTLPAVQFYTGNFLSEVPGKTGSIYGRHGGLCLETQFYPDSPNQPGFPPISLAPGAQWRHETRFAFKPH